ncbi:ATP-binding protein [uncultured Ilyobacter sp.]|uniref:ATP-binding protein n=1 Tax=uncultured Ilyobacter sp. TaxID=544433 RepID=UPI0029C0FB5D|nr:ATP-binding protein [uncultured Ilyobacter sp.]
MSFIREIIKYKKSILIFFTGLIFAVSLAFTILKNYEDLRDALVLNEQKHLLTIADTTAKSIESYFRGEERSIRILARDTGFLRDFDYLKNRDERYLGESLKIYYKVGAPRIKSIQLLDAKGIILDEYPTKSQDNISKDISDLRDVKKIIENNEHALSEVYFENREPFIYVLQPIFNKGEFQGIIRCKLSIDNMYKIFIENIRSGSKGYASVKTKEGVFLMHPKKSQIGGHVMQLRKSKYPDYDWSELEKLFEKQRSGEKGVEIYSSVWVTDDDSKMVKKFNGYSQAYIGDTFWVVTVSSDYDEVVKIVKKNYYYTVAIATLIVLSISLLAAYIYSIREKKAKLEIKSLHINEVKKLNRELEEDIEKRKLLAKELVKAKDKYEAMFNSINDCVFVADFDNNSFENILEVNEKVYKRLKYSRKELLKMKYSDIDVGLSEDERQKILEKIREKRSVMYETEIKTRFNKTIPVEVSGRLFKMENKYRAILISRDITLRKIQEETVKRSEARFFNIVNKLATDIEGENSDTAKIKLGKDISNQKILLKLEKINIELEKMFKKEMDENKKKEALMIYQSRYAAMGEMVGNIAHQWRQPLSSLSLIISNIEDSFFYGDVDKEDVESLFQKSRMLINKMSETIDDFRYFFKPKTEKEEFYIKNVVKSTVELFSERMSHNGIECSINTEADVKISGYPNQLSQVILNFINNAVDALLENREKERRIDILISEEKNSAVVEVNDNGGGIAEGVMEKIFEPYFSTKEKKNGTGIGLYMSQMIVEKNFGGKIYVTNKNDGACMKIIIPMGGENQNA